MISIITPSYNCSAFISETIQSVLSQSFADWEMIIVDDCSTDNSVEVIKYFTEKDSRIKLIELCDNSGAAVARNAGIDAANGRYISFLDSDDLWLSYKLEKQLTFMQTNNYPFTYTAYDKVNENGKVLGHIGVPDKVSYSDLLKVCSIGCLTVMYDTKYFGKVFMPLIRKRQDFGLWLRLLKKSNYAYGLNETLALYRLRSDSISSKKIDAAKYQWRIYREFEGMNLLTAIYFFSSYAVQGFLRTKAPGLSRMLGVLK